jgi:membrane protein implicated in regulation of membrane protease activity
VAYLLSNFESHYHENTQFAWQSFEVEPREDLAMSHAVCSAASSMSRPLAFAMLIPLFAAITAAILLGLLGVFVVWLCIVAVLITAIVANDVGRRLLRRLAPSPIGSLERRAVGVPGR